MKYRIWLSPPHIGHSEINYVENALNANHLAYFGANTDLFETKLQKYTGINGLTLTNSGTSAIHLALRSLGISKGDYVICPSNTFVATANPILYAGAIPVFIDSEKDSWNLCPELLKQALFSLSKQGITPKAILAVDLYGMPCLYDDITDIASNYNIPIIEDSAEALGSSYGSLKCGSIGSLGVFSFNANKIINTSGGGALLSKDPELIKKAQYLANQAKSDLPYLWHEELGYNYKFSNILAGIGVAQMDLLESFIDQRRGNFSFYKDSLLMTDDSIGFQKESKKTFSNRWLSCFTFKSFDQKESIRKALLNKGIEARNFWTPLHLQPLYKDYLSFTNGISEDLYSRGLCLPSGSSLNKKELKEIVGIIQSQLH